MVLIVILSLICCIGTYIWGWSSRMIARILWKFFVDKRNIGRHFAYVEGCQDGSWRSRRAWTHVEHRWLGKGGTVLVLIPGTHTVRFLRKVCSYNTSKLFLKGKSMVSNALGFKGLVRCDITCQMSWYMGRLSNPVALIRQPEAGLVRNLVDCVRYHENASLFVVNHRWFT